VTKRTRRRLRAEGSAPLHVPSAEPVGELLSIELVTFGAANLELLSARPDVLDRIAPSWEVDFWREHAWREALPLAHD
jgi:hypothetical protein